ncbi:MAG: glycolate oxidase subunit GlcF, partial [Acidithiobacillus ferriphilus]|nr:glycolate oxidase subunit GlcF [Acidithiobacillus ferriphilus]
RVAALARDPSEWLLDHAEEIPFVAADRGTVAFHAPCSLQHAQRLQGGIETFLQRAGYRLTGVRDSHLCCGSAGTYSILQPVLSRQLRNQKLEALQAEQPDCIATANIGCQMHLQSGCATPVRHWLELCAEALQR